MVDNSTNINKTKENLSNDSQQFLQNQQKKRKFKKWWSTIVDYHFLSFLLFCWYWRNYWPSLLKLSFALLILVENSSNINQTKESLNSDSQQFLQFQQNKTKFKQWWSTIPPISTKQKLSVCLFKLEEMLTITV
jgi:MFS superfamily sulfate permease-like transporter